MFPVRPALRLVFRGYAASSLPPTGFRGVVFHITYPFFVMRTRHAKRSCGGALSGLPF